MAPSILIPNSIYDSYRKRSRAKSNRRRKLLSSRLTILQIHLSHDDTGIDARSGALLQNKDWNIVSRIQTWQREQMQNMKLLIL